MITVSPVSPELPRQPAPQAPKFEELLPAVTRQARAASEPTAAAARRFNVSPARISQLRRELR